MNRGGKGGERGNWRAQWLLGSYRLRRLCMGKLGVVKGERLLHLGCVLRAPIAEEPAASLG